jgi:hypothetical protein
VRTVLICYTRMEGEGKEDVPKDGQQDVDEEIGIASALEEDTERWQHDGKDDLNDVASGERHGGSSGKCTTARRGCLCE